MVSLEIITLAAAVSLARAPTGEPPALEALAADVALAVELGAGDVFVGPARREAAALALVAVAWHESGFRPEVSDCRVAGDEGRSVSMWQLMGPWAWGGWSRADICTSPPLAAYLALGVLEHHARRCRGAPWGAVFAGYASGSCNRSSRAARRICRTWERLAVEAGLVGARCSARREIRWRQAA